MKKQQPTKKQQILKLARYKTKSYREIADKTDTTVRSVQSVVCRARADGIQIPDRV